jgi:diguanylate cyclase (GGDEF)-like protein/PAS domain S-box-containing protein
VRWVGVATDIHDQIVAEQALRASEARYRLLFEDNPHPMWTYDRETLRFTSVNEAATQMYGYSREEFLAMRITDLRLPEDIPILFDALRQSTTSSGRHRHRRKDGSLLWVEITSHEMTTEPVRTRLVLAEDVSERVSLHEELMRMAHHDALTGIPNRLLLKDRFAQTIARAERKGTILALLAIDLDRFKEVNDRWGHQFGDEFLKTVVQRLTGAVRATDTLARVGGDEFVCLLEDLPSPNEAERVAAKMLDGFLHPLLVQNTSVQASVSIGIALFPEDGLDTDQLRRHADMALYQAKQAGRNQYRRYAGTLAQSRQQILQEALTHALDERLFHLEYQPQYAADGRLRGLEALLRFNHPDMGPISPGEFIPVAEQCGFIVPIGTWVLEEACRAAAAWQSAGLEPGIVSVNVSALQFARLNFADTVAETLARTGLPASCLELELTESMVMADVAESTRQMQKLKALGLRLAIDDFGTGYSSLQYLHHLPIDTVKIDQSFVAELGDTAKVLPIVEAIIVLAHALDIELVAEGVESEEQRQQLVAKGCHYLQGYLLGRPVPAARAKELLPQASPLLR